MLKKTTIALLVLVFAGLLIAPAAAKAQVVVGVNVGPVVRHPYVVVRPSPYVVAPAPYVAVSPGYVCPPAVVVGGVWHPRPYAYRYRGYVVRHPYGWR